jgi:phosphoribosylaminoimidazole-succinocarboxamide synthase
MPVLLESNVRGYSCRRGKVRYIYDLGDHLVIVTTDRISAFDWVLAAGIPDKGRVLTGLTLFWLEHLGIPNHLLAHDVARMPPAFASQTELRGRTMLVRKTEVVPIECVARGYLAGSAWKEYRDSRTVGGIPLPPGLQQAEEFPEPLFTPATKAETGHDENITFGEMAELVGRDLAEALREKTLDVYTRAASYAKSRGILLADTKLEWGRLPDGSVLLIDEVLTPDSSRFWDAASYVVGSNPPSWDKQFVRDWLESTGWDKNSPPPLPPDDVIARTRAKYLEAYERLVGQPLPPA